MLSVLGVTIVDLELFQMVSGMVLRLPQTLISKVSIAQVSVGLAKQSLCWGTKELGPTSHLLRIIEGVGHMRFQNLPRGPPHLGAEVVGTRGRCSLQVVLFAVLIRRFRSNQLLESP